MAVNSNGITAIPEFTEPEPELSRIGVLGYLQSFGRFGQCGFYFQGRVQWLRDVGAALSPFNFSSSYKDWKLRSETEAFGNAWKCRVPEQASGGGLGNYPVWRIPQYKLALNTLGQYGGLVGLVSKVVWNRQKFIHSCKLFSLLANIGDARAGYPSASTTLSSLL